MSGNSSETRSTILQDLQDSVTAIEVALTELRQAAKTRQESLEASTRFDQLSYLISAGRKACADLKYFWNNCMNIFSYVHLPLFVYMRSPLLSTAWIPAPIWGLHTITPKLRRGLGISTCLHPNYPLSETPAYD
jgi:hypothetical protein